MAISKILIVEDEAIVAEDIASCLQRMNYEVVGIEASGERAIAAARTLQPNLVLMDIMLRGAIDGIEAAQQIRNELNLPIIYLTANADANTLQRAKVTGPFGYLLKPFKEKELQAAIEIALFRHQSEREAQQALAIAESKRLQAEELSLLKSNYMSMASHEFRTPLSVIKLTASLLRQQGHQLTEEKRQQYLQRIADATDSMNALLEDVLTLGRADSTRYEFAPQVFDLVTFCQELLDALQWSFEEQQPHQFQFICDYAELNACLDQKLLWHLLNNLLLNAVRYSPQGGTVSLTISRQDDCVCFQVTDQGIGIPLEDQDRLFEPFHRASNVGKIMGTGLGLAIVKRSVDLHQGMITVDSEVRQGTTFVVTLPMNLPA